MIGAVLLNAGHNVRAIDMRFSGVKDSDFLSLLEAIQPAMIGFAVTNWDQSEALRLSRLAKKLAPQTTVLWGGPQPSLCPEEIMANEEVDLLVRGEGENTVVELADALERKGDLSKVWGITYRSGDNQIRRNPDRSLIEDLSTLPRPAYELFPLDEYAAAGERRLGIFSTRGCPYGCIFCTGRTVMGRRIRCRPPEEVIAEMRYWHEVAQINHFCFNEDNLLGHHKHGEKLLDLLESARLPVTYSLEVGVRADALTDEIGAKLKRTGCTIVAIGIESVDPGVLKLAKKGETIETITRGIRCAKRAGLFVKGYFIVGLPGDSADKVRKAVEFSRKEEIDMPRFALAQAFPHTELAEWVGRHGRFYHDPYEYVLKHTDEFHGAVHYDMPDFPKDEIWHAYRWAHDQAEALSFKRALIRRFGRIKGDLLNLGNNRLTRRIAVAMYQRKWISLPK
jgi:anaerobic magnesium-protoporphyrin IX monomethyl ester cyclase